MRLFTLTCFLAFCAALFGQQSTGPSDEPAPALAGDAGFKEALFDSTTMEGILKDGSVVAVRFYNVLAKAGDANGTAMAIGIHTDGSEANKGKSYRMSLGLVKGNVQMSNLSVSKAATACSDMDSPAHRSYSASFTRTEVEALLALDGCQALQATPGTTAIGDATMLLTAMKIVGDKAEALGQGSHFEKSCGYPCPTVCGPEKNYVYRTKY
ncbi:MAG: hypothetical protein ABIY71_06275 [Flavobacteriales bacterium]